MDHIVSFGVVIADPTIPWPARGSGGTRLVDRKGWSRRSIHTISKRDGRIQVEAMCFGQLAVNVMLEGEGFAICLADTGWRISYGGAVFATCVAAMAAAEAMLSACPVWTNARECGFTEQQREALRLIVSAAEQRGEVLLDRVYP